MSELRDKLKSEIHAVDAAALLPHHRRGALLVLVPDADILEVAVSIASDDAHAIGELLRREQLLKPTLGELADWCADTELRFQFVILQPYVLAQPIVKPREPRN